MTTNKMTTAEIVVHVEAKTTNEAWLALSVEAKEETMAKATGKRDAMKIAKSYGAAKGSVISAAQKKAYGKDANNGDAFAVALKDAVTDRQGLVAVANENGVDYTRWDHLNFGMQRMNLGNVLRGMVKRDEDPVVIGGVNVA